MYVITETYLDQSWLVVSCECGWALWDSVFAWGQIFLKCTEERGKTMLNANYKRQLIMLVNMITVHGLV